ncbi:MAG: hypothetical protein KF691_10730 [Phycisphaeraceae bacterium]|nr:hypothetical protein [Phycisphaeraceae bacterium]
MLYAPILYPKTYAVFLLVAAMDVICTWIVLSLGGREINALANMFLQRWDVHGLLALKFGVCVMVLLTCEFIGRRKPMTAARLVMAAIVLNCFPVVVGTAQVAGFLMMQP